MVSRKNPASAISFPKCQFQSFPLSYTIWEYLETWSVGPRKKGYHPMCQAVKMLNSHKGRRLDLLQQAPLDEMLYRLDIPEPKSRCVRVCMPFLLWWGNCFHLVWRVFKSVCLGTGVGVLLWIIWVALWSKTLHASTCPNSFGKKHY